MRKLCLATLNQLLSFYLLCNPRINSAGLGGGHLKRLLTMKIKLAQVVMTEKQCNAHCNISSQVVTQERSKDGLDGGHPVEKPL